MAVVMPTVRMATIAAGMVIAMSNASSPLVMPTSAARNSCRAKPISWTMTMPRQG